MTTSHALVYTQDSDRYMVEIVKTWIRSASLLVWERSHAAIILPYGRCELSAGRGFLDIRLTADSMSTIVSLENILSGQLDDVSRGRLRYQWIAGNARPTADLRPQSSVRVTAVGAGRFA